MTADGRGAFCGGRYSGKRKADRVKMKHGGRQRGEERRTAFEREG